MRNQTFVVWSAMLGVGIALSSHLLVHRAVLFAVLLSLIVALYFSHRVRRLDLFSLLTCFFFLVLGIMRGQQSDLNLHFEWLCNRANDISHLASARLHSLGMPDDVTSLLDAMLLGRRTGLSPWLRNLYSYVGAAHVLALSGMHLGILLGAFYYFLTHALTYAPLRYALGGLGLLSMWAYALLTGFPVSLVRATVMASLFILSQMRLCGTDGWHTLGVAAMLILFVSPSSLWSVSFQLSFASMLGLFTFYKPLCDLLHIHNAFMWWLWRAVAISFSAQILSLPLVVYYFHQLSPYSLLFSPFYIFFASLILYSALLALLLGGSVAMLVTAFASLQHALMHCVLLLPYATIVNLHPTWAQVLLQYMAVACFVPALRALSPLEVEVRHLRLARFLRRWPYIVASVACLLLAYVVSFISSE